MRLYSIGLRHFSYGIHLNFISAARCIQPKLGAPGPQRCLASCSLNQWRVPRAMCAPHVSPRPARRGPQHCTPRAPPPHPLRCVCDITTWHGRHRVTQAAARRCKHIQMHMGGAPRSSWPPVTCATTHDAALEALLQARRTPSRASRKSMRVPSASGRARPAPRARLETAAAPPLLERRRAGLLPATLVDR